eukprot:5295622-Amphidinium_carterae.3
MSVRRRQLTVAQVKLLVCGVPGLYGRLKKANIDELLVAALLKVAGDLGLLIVSKSETATANAEQREAQRCG